MAKVVDVPHLITGLCKSVASTYELELSAHVVQRLQCITHTIVLGLSVVSDLFSEPEYPVRLAHEVNNRNCVITC